MPANPCDRAHAKLLAGKCPWCGQEVLHGEPVRSIWEGVEKSLRESTDTQVEFTEIEEPHSTSVVRSLDAESPTIIRLLDLLVSEAVELGATRVLLTPHEESVSLHFEIDAQLLERDVLSRAVYEALLERIKGLCASGQVWKTVKEHVVDAECQSAEFGETITLTFH